MAPHGLKSRANQGFPVVTIAWTKVMIRITKAHARGTSIRFVLRMRWLVDGKQMAREDMDELHLRIARVTEDLRSIQQELNCAAMQAPSDPELMEALNSLSETEPIDTLAGRARSDAPLSLVLFAGDG